ncbi:MAG TPA: hypothetical protein VMG41_15455 [Gemmatimonadales bacterium]|nr:hypothetical protein [Gemmatimonadales bacterium]
MNYLVPVTPTAPLCIPGKKLLDLPHGHLAEDLVKPVFAPEPAKRRQLKAAILGDLAWDNAGPQYRVPPVVDDVVLEDRLD